jgi:hypothetical protein
MPKAYIRCLIKHHGMKMYWGNGNVAPGILTSSLNGGEWSASRSGHFILGERAPGTHRIGDWLVPSEGLDAVTKRRLSALVGNRTPIFLPAT